MIDREELIVNSSGAKKWLLTTKVPFSNDLNEIIGLVGISRDITELKATRTVANERVTLQALIDFLPDKLWVKDVNSRFVICNKVTASRMSYQVPDDLIGKSDLELLSPDIAEKLFSDEQTIVRTGRPMMDMEECVFGASGEKTWILTTKVPLRNDQNEIFAVGAFHATLPHASVLPRRRNTGAGCFTQCQLPPRNCCPRRLLKTRWRWFSRR